MANDFKARADHAAPITAVGGLDNVNNEWHTARMLNQAPAAADYGMVVRVAGPSGASAPTSSTATITQVNDTASSTTLKAANTSRKGLTIENTSSARLYIKLGATAATTSYTVSLAQYGYYEVPFGYTGIVDGIWASDPNTGVATITELT